ncbi:MAG: hypothetical protein ACRDC6_06300 [Shewanella sp.]
MATSPSHKLGQLIGNLLEEVFSPLLQQTADKSGLYLDVIGKSRKARKGKKITWDDAYGNSHDLDFVIEFGGSEEVIGRPVAFIESAWRRYTKHSKNKAQEIQGAILPIAEKYYVECPFKGAILAGEFTDASLEQLRSCGFTVLYVRYESIVSAFLNGAEIDISFGEDTPEGDLSRKVSLIESLSAEKMSKVKDEIIRDNSDEINSFMGFIKEKTEKVVDYISITPLYGKPELFDDINKAKEFILTYDVSNVPENQEFNRFVIALKYINGDKIEASFSSVKALNAFLCAIIQN